jgi:branched-chain amino acid transport system permease protein
VGIDITRAKVTAFAVSAFIAGVGGVLYSAGSEIAAPQSFSPFDSIALLSVAVIGGLGSAAGAVIAGIFYTVAPVLIRNYVPFGSAHPDLAGVVFGAGLVVQVIVAPLGVASQLLAAERRLAAAVRAVIRRAGAHPAGVESVEVAR